MASNPANLYDIHIQNNKNGTKLKYIPGRSALTINHDQVSRTPGKASDEIAWNFKNTGQYKTYEALDFYQFSTGSGTAAANLDLSKYSIVLKPRTNPQQVTGLFMQIGDQSMMAKKSGNKYVFNLSKKSNVKNFLQGKTSKNYPGYNGVRTFTIFEYTQNDNNDNYFGKNNIVISTSPIKYDLPTANTTTIKASDLPMWRDSYQTIRWNEGGKDVNVYVGGIAEQMLKQTSRKDINFVVDEKIDSEQKLASQLVLVLKDPGDKFNDYQAAAFILDWDKKVNAVGSNNGNALIDGTNQSKHSYKNDDFFKFFNGLLDISSSYKAKNNNDYSTSVQGITFLNPPTRNSSSVQVNSNNFSFVPADEWWINNDSTMQQRLSKAVNDFLDKKAQYMEKGSRIDKVRTNIFDNQIVGGWVGASDGFESGSNNLFSGRNFTHISDDNLKIYGNNQNFIENTIHQGAYGAPISFAYGAGNGPKFNANVDGLYIHRITQPDGIIHPDPADQYGGLIMDWFSYKNYTKNQDYKQGGFGQATFKNIYIPQVNVGNQCTNALHSMGTIEASEYNTRKYVMGYPPSDSGSYKAGGYTFKNSTSYVNISQPLTAYIQDFNKTTRIVPGPSSQSTVIEEAHWLSTGGGGHVDVDVYGSSKSNITAPNVQSCMI